MSHTNTEALVKSADTTLRDALNKIYGVPPLRIAHGVTMAQLGDRWYPVGELRSAADEETLSALERRGVPLSWLVAGVAQTNAAAEVADWTAVLQKNASRSWTVAASLADAMCESLPDDEDTSEREEIIDQVHAALSSLAFSIKAKRPSTSRDSARLFRVSRQGESLIGIWDAIGSESLDLAATLRAVSQLVTGFDVQYVERLIAVFVEQVITAEITVPGFQIFDHVLTRKNEVVWMLTPRTVEEVSSVTATIGINGALSRNPDHSHS